MKKKLLTLLIIFGLLLAGCSSEKEDTSGKALLHLKVHFESNWIFSKYDVDIKIDGKRVDYINHGDDYEEDIRVENGSHVLSFVKEDDDEVYGDLAFKIEDELQISCSIHAYYDEVEIDEVEMLNKAEVNSEDLESIDISDFKVYKDEKVARGYETNPTNVAIKNEKVTVDDPSIATAKFKDHMLVVKGVAPGTTTAIVEITDVHGNKAKAGISIEVSLTDEQEIEAEEAERKKAEEEAAAKKKQEEEEAAAKKEEEAAKAKKAKALAKVKKELGSNYNLAFKLPSPEYTSYYIFNTKEKIVRQWSTSDTGVLYTKYKGTLTKGVTYKWKCADGFKESVQYDKENGILYVQIGDYPYIDEFRKCTVAEAEKALYKVGNKQMK